MRRKHKSQEVPGTFQITKVHLKVDDWGKETFQPTELPEGCAGSPRDLSLMSCHRAERALW